MSESLHSELKALEKDLSMLLVRFMKLCDEVDRVGVPPPLPESPALPLPPRFDAPDVGKSYT